MPDSALSRLRDRMSAPRPDAADMPATGEPSTSVSDPPGHPGGPELDAPAVPFIHRRSAPRWRLESLLVRLIATSGVLGIGVALGAILGSQNIRAWIIGLAVSTVSVVLAALLWSSRTL